LNLVSFLPRFEFHENITISRKAQLILFLSVYQLESSFLNICEIGEKLHLGGKYSQKHIRNNIKNKKGI